MKRTKTGKTMPRSPMAPQEQFQALNTLDLLSDLFTAAQKNTFTRQDVLSVIDHVRKDPEIFDWEVLIAQQAATADMRG